MTATSTHVDAIEIGVEKAHIWAKDVASELGHADQSEGWRMLRAVLHTLRDRLTVDEAAQLAAQLPLLVRGMYYEGWDPSRTPERYSDPRALLDRVAREARLSGETEASYALAAVVRVLRRHVSQGELEDVAHVLPERIRALLAV